MALLQSDSILTRFGTPVAVLDPAGKIVLANDAGKALLREFLQRLGSITTLHRKPSDIRDYTGFGFPTRVAVDGMLAYINPLCAGDFPEQLPEGGVLIEWLPVNTDEELRVLRQVSEAVNSSLILEDIFEALGDVLHQSIPYRETIIVILEESGNGIKILVRIMGDGTLEITGENNAFAGYDAVVDTLLQNPQPIFYQADTLPDSVVFLPETACAMVVPLINKGVVIGLIAMASGYADFFQPVHQKLLSQVSDQVAVAVENAKLYWQTQAQAGREFLINQLTKAIRQTLDIEEILSTAVQELGKVTGISRCYIQYFPKPETTKVYGYVLPGVAPIPEEALAQSGLERQMYEARIHSLESRSGEEISVEVFQEAFNPFVLNDVRDCPPFLAVKDFFKTYRICSMAVFPILIRDRLVGTITLHQCDAYRVWVLADIELLKAIAEHLGVALHQAQLFLELEQQKTTLENTLEELQQAQIHLVQSEKMAMLGQFVAGIAHEVNTPLGTISSNNETMRSCVEKIRGELSGDGSEKLVQTMENLLGINKMASERILEIVRNLRNFARLDESELKTVDLHENLDSTLLLLDNAFNQARIRVEKRYLDGIPRVECFPGLLNQVFMNLLVNAMHALDDLEPDKRQIVIETLYTPGNKQVHVAVSDTGKGIPEAHMDRIFDPGFTTKGVGVGTGLGLALCFKIVEKHQGRIYVESVPGQGTTMTVSIPVKQRKGR